MLVREWITIRSHFPRFQGMKERIRGSERYIKQTNSAHAVMVRPQHRVFRHTAELRTAATHRLPP